MNLSTQPTWTAPDAKPRQPDMTTPDLVDTMWWCTRCKSAWGDGVTPSECPVCGGDAQPSPMDALRAENERLRAALTDMLAGWRYVRQHHGDLYGVGWDRCEQSAVAALDAAP